jgi:hypothetical protein
MGATHVKVSVLILNLALLCGAAVAAHAQTCDLHDYKPVEGVTAQANAGVVTLTWQGEAGAELRARFAMRSPW